jgi:hypothetical protein
MAAGTWILTYLEFDNMENHVAQALSEVRVELVVDTEEEALATAELLWRERLAKGTYVSWARNVNGSSYDENPEYPAQPRVIYEIRLDADGNPREVAGEQRPA